MNKIVKRVIITLSIICVILFGLGIYAGNFLYNLALNNKTDKSLVLQAPHNNMDTDEAEKEVIAQQKKEREAWFAQIGYIDEYMTSEDSLKLHAYEIQNPDAGNKWVIICHGYAGNAKQMISTAQKFYAMGFNILMPDARGLGLSEGDYIGMGWDERRDIVNWSERIIDKQMDAQIVLYGVSMGGATVMMTSGEQDLPENVKVIVEDCGYSSVWGEFSYQLDALFGLPAFPFMNFASLVTKVRAGFWLGEADTVKQVSKAKVPMFFIHGDNDTFVPSAMVNEVYDVAQVPKEKYIVAGAGHSEAVDIDTEKYWSLVEEFVFTYIER